MYQNDRISIRLFLLLIIPVISVRPLFAQATNGTFLNIRLRPIQILVIHEATAKQHVSVSGTDKKKGSGAFTPVAKKVTAFSPGGYRLMVKTDDPAANGNWSVEEALYNGSRKPETRDPVFNENNEAQNDHYLRSRNADSASCKNLLFTVITP